jgi:DNA-binding beta-propeller fold protein YncE
VRRITVALSAALALSVAGSAGVASPAAADAARTIPVGGAPVAVALGAGGVWVLAGDAAGERLLELDPATGAVRASIALAPGGTENGGLAIGDGALWAASGAVLYRIDPSLRAVAARIEVGAEATSVLVTAPAVWVTRATGRLGRLVRVDPRSDRVVARIAMGGGPIAAAAAFGSIWVANSSPSSVMRVDPRTNRVVSTLLSRRFSSSFAPAGGLLWVAGDRTLVGLDAGGRVVRRIPLPRTVIDLAAAHGGLWGTSEYGSRLGRVLRIDPARRRVTETVVVGPTPVAVAAGQHAVWVANFNGSSLTRLQAR